jgi:pimeloyl-ACP methyl ester carboxylesterase
MEASRMDISINNRQIQIAINGAEGGTPVILLHHGLGSIGSWKAQIPVLANGGCRVIAYDRWGYGGSEARTYLSVPFFPEDLADLLELLDRVKVERAALVGHSDGGTIALYFAAAHPERVTCLVTVAAHIYFEPKMQPGIESVRAAYEGDARFRKGLRRLHGEKTRSMFFNWYNGWTSNPENLSWDMRPGLSRVSCPTLVIQGTEDEHASPQHACDLAAAIQNNSAGSTELWLLEGARHMLPQEEPEKFNQRVLEFIQRYGH